MISKEIEHAKRTQEVFYWEFSRVFHIFSQFALKDIHYKEVVHMFMDATRAETLLAKVKEVTDTVGHEFYLEKKRLRLKMVTRRRRWHSSTSTLKSSRIS